MKFTFDEDDLVHFVKHVNTIMYEHEYMTLLEDMTAPHLITLAVGEAIKERITSKTQDYKK